MEVRGLVRAFVSCTSSHFMFPHPRVGRGCSRCHLGLHDEIVSKVSAAHLTRFARDVLMGSRSRSSPTPGISGPPRPRLSLRQRVTACLSPLRRCVLCFAVPQLISFLDWCVVRINVTLGPKEDRLLTTGLHTVCDIFCIGCDENVGWFYVRTSVRCAASITRRREGTRDPHTTQAHARSRRLSPHSRGMALGWLIAGGGVRREPKVQSRPLHSRKGEDRARQTGACFCARLCRIRCCRQLVMKW